MFISASINTQGHDLKVSVVADQTLLHSCYQLSQMLKVSCYMQFEQCLKREVAAAEKDKDGFIKEFSQADFDAVVGGWKVSC